MSEKHRLDHRRFMVSPGKSMRLNDHDPGFTGGLKDKNEAQAALLEDVTELIAAQDLLWASKDVAVIVILQAIDAAGKDGTITHVMSGVNPQGVEVHSFGPPNDMERLHHFLWRPSQKLPARGRIAIFNRSYYEEVLVVRVHPEWLGKQWLPRHQRDKQGKSFWKSRYEEINEWERTCTNHGIVIIKLFLNVSKEEQRERLLKRLDDAEKQWKFSANDVHERDYWDQYMEAYEDMLNATSTEAAPWYIVPADKKWFTRACAADIITGRIQQLDLKYPRLSGKQAEALSEARKKLESQAPAE